MTSSSTKLKEPNLLLAAPNCRKMVRNLSHVLESHAIKTLEGEIDKNVIGLFRLGQGHLDFARSVGPAEWRQRISRFYYGAYNIRRAVALHYEGHYATDASDHKSVASLPSDFPQANTFESRLQSLRDDRNMADYNHLAVATDLLYKPEDVELFVEGFRNAAISYLAGRGLSI